MTENFNETDGRHSFQKWWDAEKCVTDRDKGAEEHAYLQGWDDREKTARTHDEVQKARAYKRVLKNENDRLRGVLRIAIGHAPGAKVIKPSCQWSEDLDGNWDTACGETFTFTDGGPKENKAHWCQYCGGELVAVPHPHNVEVSRGDGSASQSPHKS